MKKKSRNARPPRSIAATQSLSAFVKSICDIDAAVFDLKAVNPNSLAKVDTRTPQEIIDNIAAQGRIAATALVKLKALLAENGIARE